MILKLNLNGQLDGTIEFGSQLYFPDTEYVDCTEISTSTKAIAITTKGIRGVMMTKKLFSLEVDRTMQR